MTEAEPSSQLPNIKSMYQLVTGKDNTWGMEFYEVSKVYEDPIQLRDQKKFASGSPTGKRQYITKRGHYLADLEKQNKVPGPGTYPIPSCFSSTPSTKKPGFSEKKTFIDWIFSWEKKKKFPAPNSYDVLPTEESIAKDVAKMKLKKAGSSTKLNFVDTCQYNSLRTPGPGAYNPHDEVKHSKPEPRGPEFMRKYHAQQEKQQRKKNITSSPSTTKYQPAPLSFNTFSRMELFPVHFGQKKVQTISIQNGWGTEVRIVQQGKKHNKENSNSPRLTPGPGAYDTVAIWKSKDPKETKKNCLDTLSYGFKPTVYH